MPFFLRAKHFIAVSVSIKKSATSLSIQRLAKFYTHYTEFVSREPIKYEDINFRNYWRIPILPTSGGCVTSVSVLLSSFTITVTLLVLFMSNRYDVKRIWFGCLGFSSHLRIFHSHGDETSPLPVKGCKFWPMLGTHGHWAVSVL